MAIRCQCGHELPEARDVRSDPDRPVCEICDRPMPIMAETCPACGATGYPALRPRRGKKWQGSPTMKPLTPPERRNHP